jgi:glycosyltransferase involved in cell wall biosynthesis
MAESHDLRPRRVLHVAAVSLPRVDGYAVRTARIVAAQRADATAEPVVATSPFYPGEPAANEPAVIDGVEHLRCPHPIDTDEPGLAPAAARWCRRRGGLWRRPEQKLLIERFARMLAEAIARRGVEVIHAHSPFWCAAAAMAARGRAGRRIPVVYEVRGFWEESNVASGLWPAGGLRHRLWRAEETRAMRRADRVICIGEAMAEAVIARGVAVDRVTVVPNGVDPAMLAPAEAPGGGAARPVLGYVGSLRPLEGVDTLVRAAAELVRRGRDLELLIVGDGPERTPLEALASELGLGDRARFAGRVAPEEIRRWYEAIDIFAVTRPDAPVTRLVPPLKPVEAMAAGRAVIVSDLPALRELIEPGRTGLAVLAGRVEPLVEACEALLDNPARRTALGAAAREWVARRRTWSKVLAALPEVYAAAASGRQAT